MSSRGSLILALVLSCGLGGIAHAQGGPQTVRYGTVLMKEPTTIRVQSSGAGTRSGSTIGAVAGYALADRGDRWLGSLVGGALGGLAGRSADKKASQRKGWQLLVQLEGSGEEIGLQVLRRKKDKEKPADRFEVDDRVRIFIGGNGQTVVKKVTS